MAYKNVSTSTVEVMIQSFKDLNTEITGLEKSKGDKKKIKDLKKQLDEKGKKIEKKLNEDIDQITKSGKEHFLNVDQQLKEAMSFLKTAKTFVKSYEKSPNPSSVSVVEGGPSTIKALCDIVDKDADDFGSSWFHYRTFNPISQGLDKKYATSFGKGRTELMNESKGYVNKIRQMKLLVGEAEAQVKLIKSLEGKSLDALGDAQKEAQDLADKLDEMMVKDKGLLDTNVRQISQNAQGIKGLATNNPATKDQFKTAQSLMKNMISLDKELRNQFASQKKNLETTAKSVQTYKDDPQVKSALTKATKILTEFKQASDEARKTIAAATKDLAALQKNVK